MDGYQMERRQIIRGRGRSRKTIKEIIKKYFEINDLDRNLIIDRILRRKMIHVINTT